VKEADVTFLLPAHPGKFHHLGLAQEGVVVRFGIVSRAATSRLCVPPGPLVPRMQSWVGEVRFDHAICAVTLMLYGEAALTVVCSHFR
jgi:hypothetical protein